MQWEPVIYCIVLHLLCIQKLLLLKTATANLLDSRQYKIIGPLNSHFDSKQETKCGF